jgi:serine/threonine-protein kinase
MELPARIGRRYEVELELGRGEIGRVLLARDSVLGRQVAVKVLRDDLEMPPQLRAQLSDRVRQEACAAASLSHPAIVTLHDMGEDESLGLFLVFELVQGPTLREKLQGGPLPPTDVAPLARALGSALTQAHAVGLVHRDVKPENVMLTPMGPKLTDFGISQLGALAARGTGTRIVLGTPAYSAPEVLASGAFSAYSDQFSLAATLFEALTGLRAFPGGDTASVTARIATGKQAAPTTLLSTLRAYPHIDPIFDRALGKEARNRFGSCEAFVHVLASELEGANVGLLTTPMPRSSIVPRATRRWQNSAALVAFVVIVLLAVVGRYQRSSDATGVSLKSVAGEFALIVAAARNGGPSAAPHHSRGSPALSASVTSAGVTTVVPLATATGNSDPQATPSSPPPPPPTISAPFPLGDL